MCWEERERSLINRSIKANTLEPTRVLKTDTCTLYGKAFNGVSKCIKKQVLLSNIPGKLYNRAIHCSISWSTLIILKNLV